jgi:hypothetical protein
MDHPGGFRMPSWSRALAFDAGLREELRRAGCGTSHAGSRRVRPGGKAVAPVGAAAATKTAPRRRGHGRLRSA